MRRAPQAHGIKLKKQFGQHFLKDTRYLECMFKHVLLQPTSSIVEIGGGSGVLTKAILRKPLNRLWVFEIDPTWQHHLKSTIYDSRLDVFNEDILDIDFNRFAQHAPWTLLANLPYQITFPLLFRIQQYRQFFIEGVIMIQEEVAQKIVRTGGRDYGYPSLFLQWYFDWQLLEKVPPTAFNPPPKIYSRLIHFKVKKNVPAIADEQRFWSFIKAAFHQPRRTLKNNLAQLYNLEKFSEKTLNLRAQQMSMTNFLLMWQSLNNTPCV